MILVRVSLDIMFHEELVFMQLALPTLKMCYGNDNDDVNDQLV